ncbi:outer membrane transport energization protein ExbD [Novosphingobium sp. CF614]|uniref:TonB system transport protein ExbD n=1 Tax=Novosphingobium sp. CF614 TaxID=1884364 RepID=UPI0008F35E89|nr:TonB system transport protein ExbD [Novosphingobium sp. CF614]SFF92320.1 outer membrane transport energization protein ExbD [Novosphingobium sp. CF614]
MAFRTTSADIELKVAHEINVTPFIDVMLVLLIVFMIAAPLATVDIPVDLPNASAKTEPRDQEPVYLTLKKDLSVLVDDRMVMRGALRSALAEATRGDMGQRVFLRADTAVPYGDLMELMNDLHAAGYDKVALVALKADAKR